MIEMTISSLATDSAKGSSPLVVLSDAHQIRALVLWISAAEAQAISTALHKIEPARPVTHQLMLAMIDSLGCELVRVNINRIVNTTYYATLQLRRKAASTKTSKTKIITLDARPSDALALAAFSGVPIMVAPEVLATTSIPFDEEREETERLAFTKFLEVVKASDFNLEKRKADG